MEKPIKKSGCLSFALYFLSGFFCMNICFGTGFPGAQVFFGLIGVLLLGRILRNLKRNAAIDLEEMMQQTEGTFLYNLLSPKKLTKLLIAKELQRQTRYGEKLQCKAVVYRKAIYCAAALLLGALLLFRAYYQSFCIPLLCLLLLVFLWLWNSATPEQVLYEKAKRKKKLSFVQLVQDELYDEAATPKAKIRNLLAMGVLVLVFVLFFQSTAETRIKTVPTDGGVMVTAYRPALKDLKKVTLPRALNGQPVVAIDNNVFQSFSYLETVSLPHTVHSIGSRAFKNCRLLKEITLPENLTALGGEAFKNCTALTAIQIPKGVSELRGNTFEGCKALKDVALHDGITAIHAYCFRGCKQLEVIQLPSRITEIRTYTFEGCSSLKAIEIPSGVTRIASHAFHNCTALSDVYLPDTLTEIGSSAFRNCTALTSIALPQGVSRAENAFKESPTRIGEKKYTDRQWAQILQEFEGTQWEAPVYYLYNLDKGPDAICRYGTEGYVILADKAEYKDRIESNRGLEKLPDNAALIAFLEKAKADGVSAVRVYHYTRVGSDITRHPEFVAADYNIDTLITQLKDDM